MPIVPVTKEEVGHRRAYQRSMWKSTKIWEEFTSLLEKHGDKIPQEQSEIVPAKAERAEIEREHKNAMLNLGLRARDEAKVRGLSPRLVMIKSAKMGTMSI